MRTTRATVAALVTAVLTLAGCAEPPKISGAQAATERAGVHSLESAAALVASPPPLTAFLGDDYTLGSGVDSLARRWTTLLSRKEHWREQNFGLPGIGYRASVKGKKGPIDYQTQAAKLVAVHPLSVIVSGGANDVSLLGPALKADVEATFRLIRKELPSATIIALNPFWTKAPVPSGLAQVAALVEHAVKSVGGRYVDVGQPVVGHPSFITKTGTYPNDLGYARLAAVIGAALPKIE